MKHLIITGNQMVGKTLLGNWINEITKNDKPTLFKIVDDCNMEIILKSISKADFENYRPPYHLQTYKRTWIFITNDQVTYGRRITREKFLIIKLAEIGPDYPTPQEGEGPF